MIRHIVVPVEVHVEVTGDVSPRATAALVASEIENWIENIDPDTVDGVHICAASTIEDEATEEGQADCPRIHEGETD